MIPISGSVQIDENNITFRFSRSGGPGGQNVNKLETSVELVFDITAETGVPDDVRARLVKIAGKRVTKEGLLVLASSEYRTQEQNRKTALDKLIELVRKAAVRPKPRKKTRPSKAAVEKRLKKKKIKSEKKLTRGRKYPDD